MRPHISRNLASFLAGVLALVLTAPLAASLEWETTRVKHRAAPGEDAFEAVFSFRNSGAEAVTIKGVTSSCGCTVPALDKSTYAPGESGRIVAKFTFGDRLGRQVKTINVTTDEAGARPVVLSLEVEIPELISIRPRFLLWRRGEAPEAKTVTVRVVDTAAVVDLAVRVLDGRFTAQLEATGSAGEYHVVVTPRDTELVSNTSIQLLATVAGKPRQIPLFVGVR